MARCAELVELVSREAVPVGERDHILDERVRRQVRAGIAHLCRRFPLPSAAHRRSAAAVA